MTPRLIMGFLLLLSLSACHHNDTQDLKQYVADLSHVPAKPRVSLNLTPYQPVLMPDPVGRDPFGLEAVKGAQGVQPLEAYSLSSLSFVGVLEQDKQSWALIQTPDKRVFTVTTGQLIGQNGGKIIAINRKQVSVNELVQNGSGQWIKRIVVIKLKE